MPLTHLYRIIMLGLALCVTAGCSTTQSEVTHLGYAASTPLRDVNLLQSPIPQQLLDLQNPYGTTDQTGCAIWAREIHDLSVAISNNEDRRVGYRRNGDDLNAQAGNLRDVGVLAATTYFIPLRGVVRELSGAAQFDRDAIKATDRGRHRIGYLVGLGRASGCEGFHHPALGAIYPPAD